MKGRNQLLVGFSGSFENLTVVKGKGEEIYIKGKITQMTNPRTPEQVKVRERFKNCTARASALRPFLDGHFARVSEKASPYASFISRNMNRVDPLLITSLEQAMQSDFYTWDSLPRVELSLDAANSGPDGANAYEVALTFPGQVTAQLQDASDQVHFLVLNTQLFDWLVVSTQYTRSMGQAQASISRPAEGLNLVVPYLISADGQLVETRAPLAFLDTANELTLIA